MEKNFKKIFIIALISLGFLTPVFSFAKNFEKDLYFGLKGNSDVINLQKFLASVGSYSGPVTGNFLSMTLEGVKNFQKKQGITPVAGYFGPKTRQRANELLALKTETAGTTTRANLTSTVANATSAVATSSISNRILIIGDSFMALGGGIGNPLEQELWTYKDIIIYRYGKVSSGLSVPSFFDWNVKAKEMISQYNPNIVIIMLGANDNQNLRTPEGKLIFYGNAGWNEEYARRVGVFLKIFEENNITVFWVGQPIMRDANFSNAMKRLNSVYEAEINDHKNSYYISIWNIMSDDTGNYTDYITGENGEKILARVWDGIHINYSAGKIVALDIISKIKEAIKLEK
ncbi:MAG: DUF459 domain-containing protein [Candidatus Pacebacteria bacterium]|nr:DUF459 domain-containing protein [Candidatus Paceibacterota bacterium]